MGNFIDITGQKFNQLTVIGIVGRAIYGDILWLCECECKNKRIATANNLKRGGVKNCGCVRKRASTERATKHGKKGTSVYNTWIAMKKRCDNPNDSHYHLYGGRGIGYDPRWERFENFYADMGDKPFPQYTLERLNNSLGYSKDNCVWADRLTQGRNTRHNVLVSFNGKVQPISAWAEELGFSYNTLQSRLKKGWSVELSLTKPVR